MEIIVVGGRSGDKTMAIIIGSLSASDTQARIYSNEGKGLGQDRQILVDNAHGEYIIWVDCDVVLPQTYVRQQVQFMDENLQVGASEGRLGMYAAKGLVAVLENLSIDDHYNRERAIT
jgi:glycosyltransferase involved in cell wall biosynthesis